MSSVRDRMERHRKLLHANKKPKPGSPVFLEAALPDEVLLPKPGEAGSKKSTWGTAVFELAGGETVGEHEQQRIERMMALQRLIDDRSQVFDIQKGSQNTSPNVCVGRARRNDVVLVDDTISSVHAYIEDTGEALLLTDSHSKNGTAVNQRRLEQAESVALRSGDCVRFGRRVFYFLSGERLLLFLELRIVKEQHEETFGSP